MKKKENKSERQVSEDEENGCKMVKTIIMITTIKIADKIRDFFPFSPSPSYSSTFLSSTFLQLRRGCHSSKIYPRQLCWQPWKYVDK